MTTPESDDINFRSYTSRIPFARHLGFELTKFENGESEILYTAKPEHLNTFDVTHGGACMTLQVFKCSGLAV